MNTPRLIATVLSVALMSCATADELLVLYCDDCRDPSFSRDFGNFAFNQQYGTDSWLLTNELIILNPEGRWVHVDLSFQLEENIISGIGDFLGLDLGIPTGNIVIETTTDATATDVYVIDLDMVDTMGALPVGTTDPAPGPSVGGGDSSGSGGGTGGGGVGAGGGSGGSGSGAGGGGGLACTSAGGGDWHCVSY